MAIILPGGFNITNNEPVDARITLADQTARYALSSANVYEGLIVFQQDSNTVWVLTDTVNVGNENGWTQLQIGSVSSNLPSGVVSGSSQLTGSLVDLISTQTISGTKTFNDIVVNGTGSFAYIESISGSAKIIGDAFVVVNTSTPTLRYAGLSVYDSGSTLSTASFYYDGETNDWGYEYSSSTGVDYAVTIFGPEYATKGTPTYLTSNRIPKAVDNHHLNDSNISDSGTLITLNSNSQINGNLVVTGSVSANNLISGSSQIIYSEISSIPSGIVSGAAQIVPLLPTGVVSGSSQIIYSEISSIPSGIVSGAAQIVPLLPTGVVSGSSQIITTDSVTLGTHTAGNYVAVISGSTNQITVAGSGLESAVVTLSLPQNIHTSADVQFNSLGIGTAAPTTAGEIRATGDITAFYSSDIRLKENITPIQNALEKVNQISGNTYDWKEGYEEVHSHKGNDVGVIAQEIETILPQIVTNRDNGYKAVQYEKIIPLLIQAIKELSVKVDSLENK